MRLLVAISWLLVLAGCTVLPVSEQAASENATVLALVENADQATAAGNHEGAAAAIERALRVEPRNARLWNRLAHARLQLAQFDNAASLATKSNAYAGTDTTLKIDNWRLIGEARARKGDNASAQAAFAQAEELQRQSR